MAPIIEISNLRFAYGAQVVLDGIDLKVQGGTTLGVIGPNGGGKTTLMRLLLGLLNPTGGAISVAGLPPPRAIRRGDIIGYLPQDPRPPEGFPIDVRQTVRLGLVGKTGMLHGYERSDLLFVEELMQRVGVAEFAGRPVGALSGGQLQRVYIARALAPRPKLLLLDEPTTGIDRPGQQRFIEFIQQLKSDLGLTVIFVSHDLRAVSAISDRIACLNVALHYHDVPDHLPPELVYRMFACDLEAMGIKSGHHCTHGETDPHPAHESHRGNGGVATADTVARTP